MDKIAQFFKEEVVVDKWICPNCYYIYDPELGDPENGIDAGTPFDETPDNWVCPDCGSSKEDFKIYEEEEETEEEF